MDRIKVKNIKPYITKTNKTMYFIETIGGESYSTFDTIEWKEGEEIEGTIEISDKLDKNGNPYKTFKLPRKTDALEQRIANLEQRVSALETGDEEITEDKPF